MSRPNVLLFGLGSIGGVYACVLRCSGQVDVHVVARGNYEAVKKGYRLVNPKFGNQDEIHFAGGEHGSIRSHGIELNSAVYRSCEEAAKSGNTFSHGPPTLPLFW